MQFADSDFHNAITFAANKFEISSVREKQRSALLEYLRQRDVFVSLETGGGKSFIFQAAPICWDFLRAKRANVNDSLQQSLAVVVSPITALITDQISHLQDLNISAIHLPRPSESEDDSMWNSAAKKICDGHISLVYTSPETLSTKRCRDLLARHNVRENICGIFVDESHCVYKWGHSSNEAKAFRADYDRLAELRAFFPSSIPVVALTATATEQVRKSIISSLQMTNVFIIEGSPDRENIKFVITDCYSKKPHEDDCTWAWLTSRLEEQKNTMSRIIIYCRSRKQCTSLYSVFRSSVSSDRHFAMFHATTPKEVQEEIVKDFEDKDGCIRVLFATIAFGMGVDVKGVHTIIHLGVPTDIDDYIQESGRAGRDGDQSISILLRYPWMYLDCNAHDRMRTFVTNTERCRRQLLLECYGVQEHIHSKQMHTCCDVCAKKCVCNGQDCAGMEACNEHEVLDHFGQKHKDKGDISNLPQRQVPITVRDTLKIKLKEHRDSLLNSTTKYLAGGDITCGLPMVTLDKIVLECGVVISFDVFRQRYAIYNDTIAKAVWEIVERSLEGCVVEPVVENEITEQPNNTNSETSDNDNETGEDQEDSDDDFWRDSQVDDELFVVGDAE